MVARVKLRSGIAYGAIAVVGATAFAWPFWVPSSVVAAGGGTAHSGDAWIWATLLGALTVGCLLLEVREHRMNGATIATLGVLASMDGLLRLLDLPGGGNAMFFLIVLAGAALGPRFGTLLGLAAMAASAVITAGLGPWLPYQMLALAAVGAGAGVVGRIVRAGSVRVQVAALAAYGWVSGFVYGAVMNLWFWPLVRDGGTLSYVPGLGPAATLHRYWSYYVTTSFAWDAALATANVILIVMLGPPLLASLRRVAHRLDPSTVWA